jgi:transposase
MSKFNKQFKEQVVLKILNKESTIREMSTELEVHYTTVRDWVRSYREKKGEAFPGSGKRSESDEKLMKVMRENAELKEENEFLKKAAAFFAKNQK